MSEKACELELPLCDIRWTMLGMKVGEFVSTNVDLVCLPGASKYSMSGMRRMYKVLKVSISYARENHGVLEFYVFSQRSREER